MEEIRKVSVLEKYGNAAELVEADRRLLAEAKKAVSSSYAPYSKFHVGCALELENGSIVYGSNQENIAYPSGLCAERVAIFHAGAQFPSIAIKRIAITVKAEAYTVSEPVTSCGACLQSMSEFELRSGQPMRIILQGETGDIWIADGISTFMPFRFFIQELGN